MLLKNILYSWYLNKVAQRKCFPIFHVLLLLAGVLEALSIAVLGIGEHTETFRLLPLVGLAGQVILPIQINECFHNLEFKNL